MDDNFSGNIGMAPTSYLASIHLEDHDNPATSSSINAQSPTHFLPPRDKKIKNKNY
jgi:hypothetical protein